jgi:hypothetical protein
MAVIPVSVSAKEAQVAIDEALEKVAKQLRELNQFVRSSPDRLSKWILANQVRFGQTPNWHMKSTRHMTQFATSWRAKASQLLDMPMASIPPLNVSVARRAG